MEKNSELIPHITCFDIQSKYDVDCQRKTCKHWINNKKGNNCVLISCKQGSLTLQEIGKIYNITRIRICQIEKEICRKIKKELSQTI